MIRYARLLIDISLEGTFLEYIKFFNEHGILTRQQVLYEWKPIKCLHYKMFGHEESICGEKIESILEWRRKDAVPSTTGRNIQYVQQPEGLTEEFTPVTRSAAAKQS